MNEIIEIYFAKETDSSKATLASIRDLVNDAFGYGEEGMWKGETTRTSVEELREKIKAEQLVIAEQGKFIIGIILVHKTEDIDVAEFSMLAVHSEFMQRGVGRQLVEYAENWAVSKEMTTMRLELLAPADWQQASKEFLTKWYLRLGYRPKGIRSFEKEFPHLAPSLKTTCVLTEWTKRLV